jgi:predicted nucleic acid-binding protein
MSSTVIDACCLIDLLASGHVEEILSACGHSWCLPTAAKDEVRFVRRADPVDPQKFIQAPVDVAPLCSAGLLTLCDIANESESDLFTEYAAVFRSDGEAMCLALAQSRNWMIATDDRKAIRVAREAGLTILSCPELLKVWADRDRPAPAILTKALSDIERFAKFLPNATMPHYAWWIEHLKTT